MTHYLVIPAAGLSVPDPAATGRDVMLPPEGRRVRVSGYWEKRERHGDVTIERSTSVPVLSSDADASKAGE